MDILFDPNQIEVRPWMDEANKLIYDPAGINGVKFKCDLVRKSSEAKGFNLSGVPCMNRVTGVLRHWDIRKGIPGASYLCEQLVTQEWRFATSEELKTYLDNLAAKQKAAKDEAARKASGELFAQSALFSYLQNAGQPASAPVPTASTSKGK